MELEKVVSTLHLNLRIRNEDLEATKGLKVLPAASARPEVAA
jgi:hypothetical protein